MREVARAVKACEILGAAMPLELEVHRDVRLALIAAGIVPGHKQAQEEILVPFLACMAVQNSDGGNREAVSLEPDVTTPEEELILVGVA